MSAAIGELRTTGRAHGPVDEPVYDGCHDRHDLAALAPVLAVTRHGSRYAQRTEGFTGALRPTRQGG
ncbi:hypothetical protein [Streptomyces albipurpureus]|uniref:Uncharacterized protein n=1 Tax=Streptomyces albipurpureus TaxID=2897419 RepID=A0ABT0UVD0_9ACTN|nr:hypothetical protein [Streptomyces sp. CWNU-1]MCM2392539.1 hypothetical protein [Streptomyces sp. CWNU-1]